MIEQLDIIRDSENCVDAFGDTHNVAGYRVINKINELVDAVNSLRDDCNLLMGYIAPENKCEPAENPTIPKMENVDPYAEQRKWIGCLCRFWNFKDGAIDIGILKAVDNLKPTIPYVNDIECSYAFCEPVKPDDDIIYEGDDND